MENAGSVAAADRLASMPVLRNFVNQATQDLEVGGPTKEICATATCYFDWFLGAAGHVQ